MSANNSSRDFEKLQQLLRLKRYEVPPPRFFNDFSTQVTARLRAGEGNLTAASVSWWRQLWENIESKPAFSGTILATACGLVAAGIFWAGQTPAGLPGLAQTEPTLPVLPVSDALGASSLAASSLGLPGANSSTNPTMLLPGGSLFDLSPGAWREGGIQTAPASGQPMPWAPR